ncbi:MAG: hypothetical protein K5668_00890 [Lachnospiraceae bacterium]|nr:hypothetical protein [Lachnospiraceae bacterium]
MSISGLGSTDVNKIYQNYSGNNAAGAPKNNVPEDKTENAAAVYEKSDETPVTGSGNPKKVQNTALLAQLKADQEDRMNQLTEIVRKMMTGQGNAFYQSTGGDSIWKFLASGEYTVDELAKKKAQEDISEDGYWGVKKTSDRILDFAKALSGNDPTKAQELLDAFDKGYKEATGEWGKELPDISKQTYDAVHKKFEEWANSVNNVTQTEA